jgi:hypothetical protein
VPARNLPQVHRSGSALYTSSLPIRADAVTDSSRVVFFCTGIRITIVEISSSDLRTQLFLSPRDTELHGVDYTSRAPSQPVQNRKYATSQAECHSAPQCRLQCRGRGVGSYSVHTLQAVLVKLAMRCVGHSLSDQQATRGPRHLLTCRRQVPRK